MAVIPTEEEMAELSTRGQAVYEMKKELLEPDFNNQYVVIHVDTCEYVIGKTFNAAHCDMLKHRPLDGRLYGRKIGNEPEYGPSARCLTHEIANGVRKAVGF
ncbi:MAG: hypothetical protein M3Y13_09430 [Armatimonadota bacterium]|nr:hypothetical protein [Armatimonadota bacterium]